MIALGRRARRKEEVKWSVLSPLRHALLYLRAHSIPPFFSLRWCYTGRYLVQQIAHDSAQVTRFFFVNISSGHVVCLGGSEWGFWEGILKKIDERHVGKLYEITWAEFVIWRFTFLKLVQKRETQKLAEIVRAPMLHGVNFWRHIAAPKIVVANRPIKHHL